MPAPHRSSFLQARCPSCRPTNSVKALKVIGLKGIKINAQQGTVAEYVACPTSSQMD